MSKLRAAWLRLLGCVDLQRKNADIAQSWNAAA